MNNRSVFARENWRMWATVYGVPVIAGVAFIAAGRGREGAILILGPLLSFVIIRGIELLDP